MYKREYTILLTRELGKVYGFDLTFHQARHNFGTHVTLSLGVPLETVSKMMGHCRFDTTQIYAHVTDKKVDEDMRRLRKSGANTNLDLYEEETNAGKRRLKNVWQSANKGDVL